MLDAEDKRHLANISSAARYVRQVIILLLLPALIVVGVAIAWLLKSMAS